MRTDLILDEWCNATDAMIDTEVLTERGRYKGALSRGFFAIEHAARAALAVKGHEPKTHRGVQRAFNNQLVANGEVNAELWSTLQAAGTGRDRADYAKFYRATASDAKKLCRDARNFLKETRDHLI